MFFKDIIGLESTKSILLSSRKNNHVAHAQLFLGRDGSANLALAVAYATFLTCEDPQEDDACGVCTSCIQSKKLTHPDIHFFYPTNKRKEGPERPLSVDFITEWRTFVAQQPFGNIQDWASHIEIDNKQLIIPVVESKNIIKSVSLQAFFAGYKVAIIWLPESMNTECANAILKVLEEPPKKTIFILVSSDHEKLLSTITSRCQTVYIPDFSSEEIKQYLTEKLSVSESEAVLYTQLSDGNLRNAIYQVEKEENIEFDYFIKWMRFCFERNIDEIVASLNYFQKLGREGIKEFLEQGLMTIRNSIQVAYNADFLEKHPKSEHDFLQKFGKVIISKDATIINKIFNDAYYHIERNGNAKIIMMDTSIQIMTFIRK